MFNFSYEPAKTLANIQFSFKKSLSQEVKQTIIV